jgi:hypothetical protein
MKLANMSAQQALTGAAANGRPQYSGAATAGIVPLTIVFKPGWDDPENSDVRAYTIATATQFLRDYTSGMKSAIDKPSCLINVSKGCHQTNDPHFTLDGVGSKSTCRSNYAGSKSIHIPC